MTNSRIACGLWKGCQTGGGLHDPRCPASGQTTPASAEPTEDEWYAASGTVYAAGIELNDPIADKLVTNMATVLASQRAEIVARYEEVAALQDEFAESCEEIAGKAEGDLARRVMEHSSKLHHGAAVMIRQAAPK